jgi:hypothetical protein
MTDLLSNVLDDFWAVVVYAAHGGGTRLLWSPTLHAWLPSRAYGDGFAAAPAAGRDLVPYDDELQAIPGLGRRLLADRICQRCGLIDLSDHLIAPDVFGDAAMYCVQMPDSSIVRSSGGSGSKKHWGALDACNSVRPEFTTDSYGDERISFGEGLVASNVRDWEWCARCTNAAGNLARAAEREARPVADYLRDRERQMLERRKANRPAGRGRGD